MSIFKHNPCPFALYLHQQCERISIETGCWLYFSAQHMFATDPFLHYASPRILKEAKQDMEQIVNHFNRLFLTLIAARNEETKEMHKKLLQVEEREKAAREELEAARNAEKAANDSALGSARQLEIQAEEMEAQRRELEMYKAKLKAAQEGSS
ncbi:hypothetical protein C8J57DRAFT_1075533 [Mycena rebaudengoi]|nr:hypothetical protein C8J57DRAFT_1075533 [Mycena rebaudengoi]